MGMPLDGNFKDLSNTVRDIIRNCDLIIGEEKKSVLRTLATADARDKHYFLLNEHSEKTGSELISEIKKSKKVCFFSDAGTPCVADPGFEFINECYNHNIEIFSVPGPSSITAALSVSGFFAESFYFAGFPPKKSEQRNRFFKRIFSLKETVVFLERPYVLKKVSEDLKDCKKRILIAVNLGMPNEKLIRGTYNKIKNELSNLPKAPFTVVLEGKINDKK
jgi:16S rRNA (cytidine1402-2'-O)-methyltransferase